jgi:O-antigen/teichoic acid export membrane protein
LFYKITIVKVGYEPMFKYKNNKMLMNITSLGTATLINALLSFVVGIITRNILGPEQYGYWLTVSIIFIFIPIFQMGTLNAMNREIPYFIARKDYKKANEVREVVFAFIFTIPLLLVIILFITSVILCFTEIKSEYKTGLLFAALIAVLTYLSGYAETYYKSKQNFKTASMLLSIKSISQSIITIITVLIFGYLGLYLGMLFSLLVQIIIAREIFPRNISIVNTSVRYMQLIKIGFPILIVGLVWSIMTAIDRIIISIFLNTEDLGNYGIGILVFNALMLFPQVTSQVFYPKIVELVSLREFAKIKQFYWKTNIILAVVMLFIVLLGYLLLPIFVFRFMPEYINGIKAAQILLIGVYPLTLVNLAANYFNSTNNQKTYLAIQLFTILINVLLSIIFIMFDKSIISVALATSITFTIYSFIMNISFLIKIRKIK